MVLIGPASYTLRAFVNQAFVMMYVIPYTTINNKNICRNFNQTCKRIIEIHASAKVTCPIGRSVIYHAVYKPWGMRNNSYWPHLWEIREILAFMGSIDIYWKYWGGWNIELGWLKRVGKLSSLSRLHTSTLPSKSLNEDANCQGPSWK